MGQAEPLLRLSNGCDAADPVEAPSFMHLILDFASFPKFLKVIDLGLHLSNSSFTGIMRGYHVPRQAKLNLGGCGPSVLDFAAGWGPE